MKITIEPTHPESTNQQSVTVQTRSDDLDIDETVRPIKSLMILVQCPQPFLDRPDIGHAQVLILVA